MAEIVAFTDGACSGNPGPGGWGVLLQARESGTVLKERELCGGAEETTNNRMELTAALEALRAMDRGTAIRIVSDSTYLRDGITRWIDGWKRNGWRTSAKKPVKNADLWQAIDLERERHQVVWDWVRGHSGHEENERADALARRGMAPFKPKKPQRRPKNDL